MSLILRQAKGSKLTIAEMDGNLSYLEQLATANGGGNYIQNESSQTTITSGNTGTVAGVTITIGDSPVQITVTGDANPITNPLDGSSAWCKLQLYREGSAIGHVIQAEATDTNINVPFAMSFIDEPGAGTYEYTLEVIGCAGSDWQFGENDGPVIYAVELKSGGSFSECDNEVIESYTSNAKGGRYNCIVNQYDSTIIGGENNCMCGYENAWNSIIGGCQNYTYNVDGSAIIGGHHNCIEYCADYSAIIAGRCNRMAGNDNYYSAIVAGSRNCMSYSENSAIVAGCRNKLCDGSDGSTIVGGRCNKVECYSCNSTIIGGCCNQIYDSCGSIIAASTKGYSYYGGTNAIVYSNNSGIIAHCTYYGSLIYNSDNSVIIGGRGESYICDSCNSTILGSYCSYICGTGGDDCNSSILGSYCAEICGAGYSSIIAGYGHCVHGNVFSSVVIGGGYNEICCNLCASTIIGGCANNIYCNSSCSTILGGFDNNILCNSYGSTIIGGNYNTLCNSSNSAIIGGNGITLNGKNCTTMFCCIGTNYGGSNFFGVTSSNITIAGTNLCIRNGIIVGIS